MRQNRFILILLVIGILSCNQGDKTSEETAEVITDGWQVSTPGAEGFDQQKFTAVIEKLPSDNPKLDGIVIARHGKLIADYYYNGYSADKIHKIWSITKSVTGTTLGIAIDQGLLSEHNSIDAYLSEYLEDDTSLIRSITIEHLITMTSGFEWTELGGPTSSNFKLAYSKDWIEFVLGQPMIRPPGTVYNYSTGNTLLLAPIIKKATGKQVSDFAQKHLFKALQITNYEWDRQSEFWSKTQGGELPGGKEPTKIQY